jgi:two-component system chemotaxis response regulator CheB
LQEIVNGKLVRYRCHTGHAFTLETLSARQADEWERALYGAYRAQQERALVVRRMADEALREGAALSAEEWQKRAHSYDEGAELLRRLIAHANDSSGTSESSDS